jgi:non-ribosomal peptide synthase protein (TIGR01720 family)
VHLPDQRRLVLVLHHLVVDGVSWRILLTALAESWQAVRAGTVPTIDPVGPSYRRWAARLGEDALSPEREAELSYWAAVLAEAEPSLGPRHLVPERDVRSTARTLRRVLPREVTRPLLGDVTTLFHADPNDVLLTGLALALTAWRQRHGRGGVGQVLVEVEGHGREAVGAVQPVETVGWFTAVYPVRLDPGILDQAEVWNGGPAVGQALKRVKDRLHAIPDHGIGYGLLRHLNPRGRAELGAKRAPEVGFNYAGRIPGSSTEDWLPVGVAMRGTADDHMPLPHVLDVNAVVEDSGDGPVLVAEWTWAGEILPDEDAHEVADLWFRALRAIVNHAERPDAGGLSPSDLMVSLTQDEINDIEFGEF